MTAPNTTPTDWQEVLDRVLRVEERANSTDLDDAAEARVYGLLDLARREIAAGDRDGLRAAAANVDRAVEILGDRPTATGYTVVDPSGKPLATFETRDDAVGHADALVAAGLEGLAATYGLGIIADLSDGSTRYVGEVGP